MKEKFKTVIMTFVATTLFWCLAVVGIVWFQTENSGASVVEDARQRGFVGMMSARNEETQPVTFTVEELRTNIPSGDSRRVVLLERQLPPAGEFWIGIKKEKTEIKP